MKIVFKDKVGNKLIQYANKKWAVKNAKGKLVTKKEFWKFIRRNKIK